MTSPTSRTSPQDILLWAWYRRVRPLIWRTRTLSQLNRLTDDDFRKLACFPDDDEALREFLHQKLQQRLFFHSQNRKEFFISVLTSLQQYDDILDEADEVLENRFETLGSGLQPLGENINWHRDFKSGTIWPVAEPSSLDLLQLGKSSDVKVPWELSRFHQVWWLGKAYWLTNGQRYADKFMSLVDEWHEANPIGLGVNWSLAMEAAIRSSNMIIGYSFFSDAPTIPASFWVRFFKSLYVHGMFIEQNLEYAVSRGNHFLSNVSGLVLLGCVFKGTAFGDRWFSWGVKQLEVEMGKQVYPDGVNYEKSTAYHRFVLELFYAPVLLAERNGHTFSAAFKERLHRMFAFVAAFQRPDGSIPNIGDADDGRLFRVRRKQEVNDCRHALAVGAAMYNDSALRAASGGFHQDALWLIGTQGFEAYRASSHDAGGNTSLLFPDGGFAVLRTEDVHVMVDVGDIGMEGRGGHGHNDTLSFEYWADGHPIVVDSGTYVYTADQEIRQQLRGVRSHNTVMVDEREIAEFSGLWSIRHDETRPVVTRWSVGSEQDTLVAKHEGYIRLTDPVVHTRTFEFDKATGKLIINDHLKGDAEHALLLSLHLHPDIHVESEDNKAYILRRDGHRYRVLFSEDNCAIADGWFSPSYGVRHPSKVLRVRRTVVLPHIIQTTIERIPG